MMKKTFLFFSAQYLPTTGGVERLTNALAKKLISHNHRVIVATSSLKAQPDHEIDADGIEIFRLPAIPFMNGRLPLLRPCPEFFRLAKQLWEIPIDFCVINTYFYPLSMYAASQIHKRHIPALILNHGSAWLMTGNKILEFAGQIYERISASLCYHYCKNFYGVSSAAETWLKTFRIPALGTITNAIDPESVIQLANPEIDWRRKLALPQDAKIIAFVGRMIPEKGVSQMIDAMCAIRRAHQDAYLVMAGSGPMLDSCRDTGRDGVFLVGNQPYSDVLALLQQATLFCLPSRSEGFACTVLEAAALECPILTTATGGSPQLLIDPSYGILLENMDASTISKACIHALDDPQWRNTAAKKARQRMQENYTWDAAIAQLYQAFRISCQHSENK